MKKLLAIKIYCKEHIGYVSCSNGKTYDLFSCGDRFGFYSKSTDKKMAGEFRIFDTITDCLSKINEHNGCYDDFYFDK